MRNACRTALVEPLERAEKLTARLFATFCAQELGPYAQVLCEEGGMDRLTSDLFAQMRQEEAVTTTGSDPATEATQTNQMA